MEHMGFGVPQTSKYTKEEYQKICALIAEHNFHYFVENAPKISDYEFDQLFNKLIAIEKAHPEWVFPGSPTQRVGERISHGFITKKHTLPMLSLANTYSFEEIQDFIRRIEKWLDKEKQTFHAELKLDGIAISVTYKKRLFFSALTRGDGTEGEDVTENVRTIAALPLQLPSFAPDLLEIRGEVFLPKKKFTELNLVQKERGKPLFANPRNAAGGSLKLLDPKEVAKRGLSVAFYSVAQVTGKKLLSQYESIEFLKGLHLPVVSNHFQCHTFEEIVSFAETVNKERSQLPFEIDGIVVKVDDLRLQEELGVTGKNYRWAVAYKFAAEQAETKIHSITVQVGRTGVLTPVAELLPVFVAGSMISRATLHNEDEVRRKDIRVGDTVLIEKGGDVIPKVVSVVLEKREKDSVPWHMPHVCPACGSKLVRAEEEVALHCSNKMSCPAQTLRRIIFFASKAGMDIEHLGKKVVELLVEKGFVEKIYDIYTLTAEQLLQLKNFKEKSVQNLLISIEKSKEVPLEKLIMALGIPYVGAETAESLALFAKDLQTLSFLDEDQLKEIDGVGDKVAEAVVTFFADPEHQEEIARLLELGVRPFLEKSKGVQGHVFEGKSFVITGTMENYSRAELTRLIKERGGKVSSSVSNHTDYLLVGESPGSKLEQARRLSIMLLSEKEFINLL